MSATVVVVDDNAMNRALLVALMEHQGHRVFEAVDGQEGLSLARNLHPELVISDLVMPTMDGYEFVRQLRADRRLDDVGVIFYTAHYQEGEAQRLADACDVARVLIKPCRPAELLSAVEQVLTQRISPARPAAPGESFDREHLQLVTNKLAQKARELQLANDRLTALTELNLQLASERDLRRLLDQVCCGARNLLGAKYGVLAVTEKYDAGQLFMVTSGIENAARLPLPPLPAQDTGPLGRVFETRVPLCLWQGGPSPPDPILPDGYPHARALLAVPICSLSATYGWLCLADKTDGGGFGPEDQRLLGILAAQAGRIYENASLHRAVQIHAAQLQIEIDERETANVALRLVEQRIQHLNRLYAMLSGINSLIVRASDQQELFTEACRLAVMHGGFPLAWIGLVAAAGHAIKPVACAGNVLSIAEDALGRNSLAVSGDPFIAAAVASCLPQICDDLAAAERGVLFAAAMLTSGCRSLVVLPLKQEGATVACLVLAAAQPASFDAAEMDLLSELADDISFALDHIATASQLNYLAYYDSLTGFPNRTLFLERIAQNITAAAHRGSRFLVVIADLERFDTINDTYGRKKGDELLKEIAERFRLCMGDPDAVARVGPDHFAAIIPFSGEVQVVIAAFEHKYQAWLGAPFFIDGTELRMSARSGIALYPHDGAEPDSLLKGAEAALKRAKTSGDKVVLFTKDISLRVAERLALETQLRRALDNREFVLHYQPKVDLETRAVSGVEALLRWMHPELGLVPPAKFVGILEETGLIVDAGAWALRRAAEDRLEWLRNGLDAPRIAVNVSSVQVRRADFVAVFVDAIAPGGRAANFAAGIDIEVTESLLLENPEANIGKLKELRRLGIGIAIDDFGTGYSSLSYLAKLPVACLKIDRSFTANMLDDPGIMTLVSTMITLAHSLKLKVIAEGVESEEQAKILRLLRCDQMQGYLISKPLPLEQMTRFLERARGALATAG